MTMKKSTILTGPYRYGVIFPQPLVLPEWLHEKMVKIG